MFSILIKNLTPFTYYHMEIDKHKLTTIVARLMHQHKGILAADESNTSCNKRFEEFGIAATEENRRRYRELLITTPHLSKYISGIILFDETIRQMTEDGRLFRDVLKSEGILIGIKVDEGLVSFENSETETITQGLSGLRSRLSDYKQMNAVFTKWRSAFRISENTPTEKNIRANCSILAEYAEIVQSMNMIPILEPEVLMEGDHTIEQAREITSRVIAILFEELEKRNIYLGGCILKTSMIIAGNKSHSAASHELVAEYTSKVLRENVPPHTGGVVFLSGGQSGDYAVHNLNEIAQKGPFSWPVTFSFSRAIQSDSLSAWEGKDEKKKLAQKLLIERLELNTLARQGKLEHGKDMTSRHEVSSLRGFFMTLVVLVVILLIILT